MLFRFIEISSFILVSCLPDISQAGVAVMRWILEPTLIRNPLSCPAIKFGLTSQPGSVGVRHKTSPHGKNVQHKKCKLNHIFFFPGKYPVLFCDFIPAGTLRLHGFIWREFPVLVWFQRLQNTLNFARGAVGALRVTSTTTGTTGKISNNNRGHRNPQTST